MRDVDTILGILAADGAELDLPLDLVNSTAKDLSYDIYSGFFYLNAIDKQHGATISAR